MFRRPQQPFHLTLRDLAITQWYQYPLFHNPVLHPDSSTACATLKK
jgi:hypothetical protein